MKGLKPAFGKGVDSMYLSGSGLCPYDERDMVKPSSVATSCTLWAQCDFSLALSTKFSISPKYFSFPGVCL